MKALCGAATALTCVGAVVSLASPAAAGPEPRTFGPSFVYDDRYAEVLTSVTVRATERSTGVTLEASNFPRSAHGRTFGAHVHVDRCGPRPTDAGAHYQTRDGGGSLRDRELWLDFTVDREGRGVAHAERPWTVPSGTANSVVVHERRTDGSGDAGNPILCTTVPFRGAVHTDQAVKPAKPAKSVKTVKHDAAKQAKPAAKPAKPAVRPVVDAKTVKGKKAEKKADLRVDTKSPEPKAAHHAHEQHAHHEAEGRAEPRRHDEARRHEAPRHEVRRDEAPRHETRRHEEPRHEARRDEPRREAEEPRRHEAPRHEARRDETRRDAAPRHEAKSQAEPRRAEAKSPRDGLAQQVRSHARSQQKQWSKPYESLLEKVRSIGQSQRQTNGG